MKYLCLIYEDEKIISGMSKTEMDSVMVALNRAAAVAMHDAPRRRARPTPEHSTWPGRNRNAAFSSAA